MHPEEPARALPRRRRAAKFYRSAARVGKRDIKRPKEDSEVLRFYFCNYPQLGTYARKMYSVSRKDVSATRMDDLGCDREVRAFTLLP